MTDLRTVILTIASQLAGTYINVDGFAGNQCWDSQAKVSQLMGLPVINTGGRGRWPGWAGNMWDAFPQSKEIDAAYYRVGPDKPAMPGDKAIWGDSYEYYPATHVADVIADAGGLLLCLSQNSSSANPSLPGYSRESSGPTIIQHLPKRGLLGYIRPRAGIVLQGEIITPKEDTLSADEVRQINDHTTLMLSQIALDGQLGGRTRGGMADVADKIRDVHAWLRGGESGVRNAGPIPAMLADIQGQNAGLLEALKQATNAPGSALDLEAIKAASKTGAAEALADLEATATTTITLSQEG